MCCFCVTIVSADVCTRSRLPMFVESNGSMDSQFRSFLFVRPKKLHTEGPFWLILIFDSKKMTHTYHFFKSDYMVWFQHITWFNFFFFCVHCFQCVSRSFSFFSTSLSLSRVVCDAFIVLPSSLLRWTFRA